MDEKKLSLYSVIENKKSHFNNQLNKLENYNKSEIENASKLINNYIIKHNINKSLLNNNLIYQILKSNNCKKDFIFIMHVSNKLHNINFELTFEKKRNLIDLFELYVKFLAIKDKDKKKKNIHYSLLFYYFFKFLNIESKLEVQEKIIESNIILDSLKEFIEQINYNFEYKIDEHNDMKLKNSYFGNLIL